MNQIRSEFEAKFPMPEQAVYQEGDYVWASHCRACHPYNQLYRVWCEAHATYAGASVLHQPKKWRVDDLVTDRAGALCQIQGVRGSTFLISQVQDAGTQLSFVSADQLVWHSRKVSA